MSTMLLQLTTDPRSPRTEHGSAKWPHAAKESHRPDCISRITVTVARY